MASTVTSLKIVDMPGNPGTLLATWKWDKKEHLDNYKIRWYSYVNDGRWILENETTSDSRKESTWSYPDYARKVKIRVKPVSTKDKKGNYYWKADWAYVEFNISGRGLVIPSAPEVEFINKVMKMSVNFTAKADKIEFAIFKTKSKTKFASGEVALKNQYAAWTYSGLIEGTEYSVRCRSKLGKDLYSDWSEYAGPFTLGPKTPGPFTKYEAQEEGSVKLVWKKSSSSTVTSYVIEYTTKKSYFDKSPSNVSSVTIETGNTAIITGLSLGETYYFRCKAVDNNGESGWNDTVRLTLGREPAAPTTWTLTSKYKLGDKITFYWNHNSQDNSSQVKAKINFKINGKSITEVIDNRDRGEYDRDKTSSYTLDTSRPEISELLQNGGKIEWMVKTAGIYKDDEGNRVYSEWSVKRTVYVYETPYIYFIDTRTDENNWLWDPFEFTHECTIYNTEKMTTTPQEELTHLPMYIRVECGPDAQKAIRYFFRIVAEESYETVNFDGTTRWVSKGDEVFSKYYDASENELLISIKANELTLENSISYTLYASVVMDSGLSAECSAYFTTNWSDNQTETEAIVEIDKENLVAYITPYISKAYGYTTSVRDDNTIAINDWDPENGDPPDDITKDQILKYISRMTMSVYRINYDGTFEEIGTELSPNGSTSCTDRYPALDYARYRVVSRSSLTTETSWSDIVPEEVAEKAIIIQWDYVQNHYATDDDDYSDTIESMSMLKLPYNIDISYSHSNDVSTVAYLGREHPVSYFGTMKEDSMSINCDIDMTDYDTIFQLRKLQNYLGNCYVREPSGVGYWAVVSLSMSKTHKETAIPVSLTITRVEGDV